jgi:predicted enzyme related to lactoylglutathione lyase
MQIIRILTRFYTDDLERSVKFYGELLKTEVASRFKMPAEGLELAVLSDILIIGGTEAALKPFRTTGATFLVDSVVEFKKYLLDKGCTIIRDIAKVPTGFNLTLKHPDGTIIEYVEHR